MKRTILFSLLLLISGGLFSANAVLSYRMANATLIPGSPMKFQYDIQVKADIAGTKMYSITVRSNFSDTAFVGTSASMLVVLNPTFNDGGTFLGLVANPPIGGTAPNQYFTSSCAVGGTGGHIISNVVWETMFTVTMEIKSPCAVAGLTFIQSYMQTRNKYRTNLNYTVDVAGSSWNNQSLGYLAPTNTTWNGSVSTNWLTSGNWSVGVPCDATNVTIGPGTNACVLDQNVTVNNLTVADGGQLTIPVAKTLTVNGTLLVQSGGSMIQDLARTATVERNIPAYTTPTDGWHFLSSPVTAQAIQTSFVPNPPGLAQDFYMWDESCEWINSRSNPATWNPAFDANFIPGKGYLVAYQNTVTKSFSGTLNTGNVSRPVTYSSPYLTCKGWNLLGNPFTSAIFNTGLTGPIAAAAVQIWDGSAYTVINSGGIIPALNGFMVEVNAAGTVTIPASSRTHNSAPWLKASNDQIKLVARNAESVNGQESVVRFNADATEDFDSQFDAHYLPGYAPIFYSYAGDVKYASNTLPAQTWDLAIPFGFEKNNGTNFAIELKENIADANVFLTDLKTNTTQDMTTYPVYNFTSASGDDVNRFVLKFSTVGIDNPMTNNSGIYVYNNRLYIDNPGKATIEIFNITGQKIMMEEVNSGSNQYVTNIHESAGYYVVRVISDSGTRTAKVLVR